jgi:hypothetical protein
VVEETAVADGGSERFLGQLFHVVTGNPTGDDDLGFIDGDDEPPELRKRTRGENFVRRRREMGTGVHRIAPLMSISEPVLRAARMPSRDEGAAGFNHRKPEQQRLGRSRKFVNVPRILPGLPWKGSSEKGEYPISGMNGKDRQ